MEIKKIIISVGVAAVLIVSSFIFGRCSVDATNSSNKYIAELKQTITELRTVNSNIGDELAGLRDELAEANRNIELLESGIDRSIEFARYSDGLIESIRQSSVSISETSGDIRETVSQLIDNQLRINEFVIELQDINNRLKRELGTVR